MQPVLAILAKSVPVADPSAELEPVGQTGGFSVFFGADSAPVLDARTLGEPATIEAGQAAAVIGPLHVLPPPPVMPVPAALPATVTDAILAGPEGLSGTPPLGTDPRVTGTVDALNLPENPAAKANASDLPEVPVSERAMVGTARQGHRADGGSLTPNTVTAPLALPEGPRRPTIPSGGPGDSAARGAGEPVQATTIPRPSAGPPSPSPWPIAPRPSKTTEVDRDDGAGIQEPAPKTTDEGVPPLPLDAAPSHPKPAMVESEPKALLPRPHLTGDTGSAAFPQSAAHVLQVLAQNIRAPAAPKEIASPVALPPLLPVGINPVAAQPVQTAGVWEAVYLGLADPEAPGDGSGPTPGPAGSQRPSSNPAGQPASVVVPPSRALDVPAPVDLPTVEGTPQTRPTAPAQASPNPPHAPAQTLPDRPQAPDMTVAVFEAQDVADTDAAAFPIGTVVPLLQVGGASATASLPGTVPPQALAAQIAGALVHASDSTTELTLAPEELGKVRLRFETDAQHPDRMVIMISFDRPETLDLFRRHAGDLAEAIRSAGYSGADIGFDQHDRTDTPERQQGSWGDETAPVTPGHGQPALQTPGKAAGSSLDLRL
jgi:Flagellar hook-length control protein FliK